MSHGHHLHHGYACYDTQLVDLEKYNIRRGWYHENGLLVKTLRSRMKRIRNNTIGIYSGSGTMYNMVVEVMEEQMIDV